MRLVMLGPYPVDGRVNDVNGGVQAVIVNMIRGLARFSDMDIHIITTDAAIKTERHFISNAINIHVVARGRALGNLTSYLNTRRRICKKINEIKPDLVHSHMFGYYTLAALSSGHRNVIVSTHGISNKDWGMDCYVVDRIRHYFQDIIYYKCAKNVKYIILNSPYTAKTIKHIKDKIIFELNNPVSDIFFENSSVLEENKRILFVGNICEAKGIMTILRSINLLKQRFGEINIRVAGNITDRRFYARAVKYISDNKMDNYVSFLGHLNDAELKEEYRRAGIFIFPSNQDVAPLALLQAMAAKKAIIAARVGGIPYIIDDGVNGILIRPGDYAALADKIILLIEEQGLRKKIGLKAGEKVCEGYRINAVTDRLYEIYKGMIGEDKGR